ncbi:MAG: hypothetical protein IJ042_07380 [Butyricicoccus sp.]|nr:hypothetical protein [Butyricicoccus sp.]
MTRDEAIKLRAKMENTFAMAAASMTGDQIITNRILCKPWSPGVYAVGDVRTTAGGIWSCCQAHDSTANPAWTPDAERALWAPYHGTTADTALPFVQPTGAHDMYKQSEYMIYTDGQLYRCLSDTAYSPTDYADAWEVQ